MDPLQRARALTPPGAIWPHPVEFTAAEKYIQGRGVSLVLTGTLPQTPAQGAPRSIIQYAWIDMGGPQPLILVRP